MTNETPRALLDRTLNFIRLLREVSSEMPMQQAHILVYVAMRPGITMAELSKETQLAQSSCSRSVAALSEFKALGQPGLNLVEAAIDPHEPRRRVLYLTMNGKTFVEKLMQKFDEDFELTKAATAGAGVRSEHSKAKMEAPPSGVAKAFSLNRR